ncbi:MAG: hypothetical protein KIT11_11530 [Fimbriimonadaceae bacterium]|nr:hypothetical protein [Fimbriimonadaceae bacterium]QYK55336.1 MAG: hypothetical protein KF733_10005 [Fimbriimonadaceae bacterium]
MHERDEKLEGLFEVLRENALDPDVGEQFDRRVLREWRLRSATKTIRFWTPALMGAAVAAMAVLAVLQLLLASPDVPRAELHGQEARRSEPVAIPTMLDPSTGTAVR